MLAQKKRSWNFLCFDFKKEPYMSQIVLKWWLIGNRTSCRPIRSVIKLVIKQIGLPLRGRTILLITRIITDQIGLHSVLLPLLIAFLLFQLLIHIKRKESLSKRIERKTDDENQ